MTVSYNWLKDYLKFDLQPEKVAEILTSTGLEVEHIETVEQIPGGLEGVVVAHVLECTEHPDSDHLHVTKLDVGTGEPLQVVCGAPNVAAGQKVLLATVGTKLVNLQGEELKLKKSKIRGVESFGMICAEDELGIGEDHSGIMVLDDSAVPGTPARVALNLKSDTVYEIGLTPNRIDGASHIGAARDLYAYCKLNGIPVEWTLPSVDGFASEAGDAVPVEVVDPDGAPRYIGITIKDVKVGPSPDWLRERLNAIGQHPINNVVDVTNFILNEMCQPLHVFDISKINGGKVIVRKAAQGEKIVTLDGIERTLTADDMVIADAKGPMCIAGVFGGEDSGVTEATRDVFLECAYFNPVYIRKTSKRHALQTDASFRYERGIDIDNAMFAAKRAAMLIAELGGGHIVGKVQEFYPQRKERAVVDLNFARMESLIGKKIGSDKIVEILTYLDFEILGRYEEGCRVAVPAYRVDVTRECDVVEEVLRIYGYNNIEFPEGMRVSVSPTSHPDNEVIRKEVSDFFTHNGFLEIMNNSLTKSSYYDSLETYPASKLVKLLNPLSADLDSMRQTLLFGGLEVVSYNIKRQCGSLRLYEIGNVYSYRAREDDPLSGNNLANYSEHTSMVLLMSSPADKAWRNEVPAGNFFLLKGYLETLVKRLGMDLYAMEAVSAPEDIFAEGMEYKLQGKTFATLGTVSKKLLKAFDIKQQVFAAEISWPVLFEIVRRNKVKYKEMPRYPEVRRDLALLLDENVSFSDLRKTAFQTEKQMLKNVSLFDVYRGDKIPAGKKQYALNFVIQNPDQTLTDNDVERIMGKILGAFENKHRAALR
jgi:phenylalanyl-tRNA synthetase beta chain